MPWLKTGVLCDRQIKSLLGKKIFIYPFYVENLKGSTYNLTASMYAFSASENELLINEKGKIQIPAGETALIQTEESIFVTKDICGTYHSKVKLVSKGLSHIGTTLDPLFFGTSLIAVHNHSKQDQYISVGETFASIMLHKMPSSTKLLHDNQPFRSDITNMNITEFKYDLPEETKDAIISKIEEWKNQPWRTNKQSLIDIVKNYVKNRDRSGHFLILKFISIALSIAIVSVFVYLSYKNKLDDKYMPYIIALVGFVSPIITSIEEIIKNYLKGE
ncbi:MAG: deoxycytidine triphosphate deaminase [Anaerosolibacter sp.]|jgi:deoxycytidine triphosphate deaminase|uniref:hypothetical protein n=1 Tax=Anaerosolibacter sp. TaxID=1872527 RepID=UPI0026022053|nr:hypothetical protein [Anaerosolibacter sp.]MDF2545791.1 deoxycytidine triphosphate deaminase [Anaerosolibacter sp.]